MTNTTKSNFALWYDKTYPELSSHGIYLRGGELNTVAADQFAVRPFKLLITRLSTYGDTSASYSHKLLYQIAAEDPAIFPDMAYLPPQKDSRIFDRDEVPWILGTTSKHGARDFDCIAFSNSFAAELINLPTMLAKSGIPLRKSDRMADPSIPLIMLGGANALYTSIYYTDDPMIDVIFVGEDTASVNKIFSLCRSGKQKGLSKVEICQELMSVQGIFLPEKTAIVEKGIVNSPENNKIKKFHAVNLGEQSFMHDAPVLYSEDQIGSAQLQVSEGCPGFCTFCSENWVRKPYREVPGAIALKRALAMKAGMGLDDVEISSFNFNMYSQLYDLLWELPRYFETIGLKSQRFDLLARDSQLPKYLHLIGKSSMTCGLEGISERVRRTLNKNLSDADLRGGLRAIFGVPLRELKIFLIATGLEQDDDYAQFKLLLSDLSAISHSAMQRPKITFSITPLLRFPWTPLEFADAVEPRLYQSVISKISTIVKNGGYEFRQSADLNDYWISQLLVRADDCRLSEAFFKTIAETGEVYYRDVSGVFVAALKKNLADSGVVAEELFRGFTLEESEQKPWARLETGVSRKFLYERYCASQSCAEVSYCLATGSTPGTCHGCGGCPDATQIKKITHAQQSAHAYSYLQFRDRIKSPVTVTTEVSFLVRVTNAGRGITRKYIGVALARALMKAEPALVEYYRKYSGSFWSANDRASWIVGDDVISLLWDLRAVPIIMNCLKDTKVKEKINNEMTRWGELSGIADEKNLKQPRQWRLMFDSPFSFKPDSYLKKLGLKYVYKKIEENFYSYDLTPDSKKKKILSAIVLNRKTDGSCVVDITPDAKFDLNDFLHAAFDLPAEGDWVRVVGKAELLPRKFSPKI